MATYYDGWDIDALVDAHRAEVEALRRELARVTAERDALLASITPTTARAA